jgi:hypothetical protein
VGEKMSGQSINDFSALVFSIFNYIPPLLTVIMAFVAVKMQSRIGGYTKDLAIAICASLAYIGLHAEYMHGVYRFPLFIEFPWRGLHMIMFYWPLRDCLKSIRSAKEKNIKIIKTPLDQAA